MFEKREGFLRLARQYKNKLGLLGIPSIEELRPQKIGLFFGKVDEFVHIAFTLKQWKRDRKSLADYVEDEGHRDAVLEDLHRLFDIAKDEIIKEKAKPSDKRVDELIENRKYFLEVIYAYEESKLLAWEAPLSTEALFDFENIQGRCYLTLQGGAVTKLRLELEESGLFSLYWKQAGDCGKTGASGEPIAKEIRIESGKGRVINLLRPMQGGMIYIHDHTRKAVERVPVS